MADALDLDALEATAKAATPGPWEQGNAEDVTEMTVLGIAECHSYHRRPGPCPPPTPGDGAYCEGCADYAEDDARFIAAANPATVLALIARIRGGEDALARVRAFAYRQGIPGISHECYDQISEALLTIIAPRAEATPERGQTYSNSLEAKPLTPTDKAVAEHLLNEMHKDAPS